LESNRPEVIDDSISGKFRWLALAIRLLSESEEES